MVIDQCIVQMTIKMIVHIMKQLLELVYHYSIGKFNTTMFNKEKYNLFIYNINIIFFLGLG